MVAGSTDISGTSTKEGFREPASGVVGGTKGGIRLSLTGITAEGNRVAVEVVSDGETLEGKRYLNQYHFLFEFKMANSLRYADTLIQCTSEKSLVRRFHDGFRPEVSRTRKP